MEEKTTVKKKKVTLLDIANRVGVTKGLVSLALSDSDLVNENTRAEIILAALEMGYDLTKRKISQVRTKLYSLIVRESSSLNTFFWAQVIKGMEVYLSERSINLDLIVFKDAEKKNEVLLELVNKKTQGIIIVADCDRKRIGTISKSALPIVVVDGNNYYGSAYDCVVASNYISAYSAARYLVKKGHRSIAFVGNKELAISFKQRAAGFRDGAQFSDLKIIYNECSEKGTDKQKYFNEKKFNAILNKAERPTAIMCSNDYTACEVYDFIKKKGFSVPEDISLVGFDNIELDHELIPRLTTFEIPKMEMGRVAVELLEERINNPDRIKKIVEVMACMVERESVKDLNETRNVKF